MDAVANAKDKIMSVLDTKVSRNKGWIIMSKIRN